MPSSRALLLVLALGALGLLAGCDVASPAERTSSDDLVENVSVELNPSGYAPLTARLAMTTRVPVSVELTVRGRRGAETDVRHHFSEIAQTFSLPVLGLYAASTNHLDLRLLDASGAEVGRTSLSVATPPLLADLPRVEVEKYDGGAARPGFTLVSYFGHASTVTPQRPFAFDPAGAIRWYLDLRGHPQLGGAFFDNGLERLRNGNFYGGDRNTSRIYEITMLGDVVRTWNMPGYSFHHHVLEKPDGNFLVTVNKLGAATVEDHVIEIDRLTGAIVNVWDLRQSLDPARRGWPTSLANLDVDWFHGNALAYDDADGTILVSGRTQGVVKLTPDNRVVWILAPHRSWATAGDGTDLATRVLTPLDASGAAITDPAVLDGTTNHPDFEWAWYQHAPKILPDGSLLLFDNGDNRNYAEGRLSRYSRAVVYRIDGAARTIQQQWQYGKERGEDTYSRIVSDVDHHDDVGTIVFMPGAVQPGTSAYGKIVEITRVSRRVVFEATLTAPTAPFGITFHRAERLRLYASE